MSSSIDITRKSSRGEPTWEVVDWYPRQGDWSEVEYLHLDIGRLVEFDNGVLEIHSMPTREHQRMVMQLLLALNACLQKRPGWEVIVAPVPLWIAAGQYREPDLALLRNRDNGPRLRPEDVVLCVEIPSPGRENRERDLIKKRAEYAAAGIPEYWIIDPETNSVTVYQLVNGTYSDVPAMTAEGIAVSHVFPEFQLAVGPYFESCRPVPPSTPLA